MSNANFAAEGVSENASVCKRNFVLPNAEFNEALTSTYGHIEEVLKKLCSSSTLFHAEDSMNLSSWKSLFVDFVADLRLDVLCEKVFKTVTFGVSFV